MSHVTDIILCTSIDDGAGENHGHPNVAYFSERCELNLVRVDDHAGGNKAMQCDVFMSSVNGLYIDKVIEQFALTEWEYPECVQLFIKDENEDLFTIYTPNGIRFVSETKAGR